MRIPSQHHPHSLLLWKRRLQRPIILRLIILKHWLLRSVHSRRRRYVHCPLGDWRRAKWRLLLLMELLVGLLYSSRLGGLVADGFVTMCWWSGVEHLGSGRGYVDIEAILWRDISIAMMR